MLRRSLASAAALCAAALLAWWPRPATADAEPGSGDEAGFLLVVKPFLERHCYECHGRGEREGDLALDAFPDRASVLGARAQWSTVVERLHAGDMPPDDRPRPPADDVAAVIAWVRAALGEASRPAGPFDPGRVTLRRLNRAEYDHTVQDLLRVDLRPAAAFPDDDVGARDLRGPRPPRGWRARARRGLRQRLLGAGRARRGGPRPQPRRPPSCRRSTASTSSSSPTSSASSPRSTTGAARCSTTR